MKHELKPVEPPFPADIAAAFARYPKGDDGYILKLFRVFANSRRFLTSKGVVNLLDSESPLSLREREIVILRVAANRNCEYEWGVHVSTFAKAAKLSDQQIRATRLGNCDATCWTAREGLLIDCVDQLCAHSTIADAAYLRFQEQWDLPQQLEILALCGNYMLVSLVANTARIALEEDAATFPH